MTGLGPVTCIGTGRSTFWSNLTAGKSGIVANTLFDCTDLASRVVAPVTDFEPTDYMSAKVVKRTDRFTQLAIAATQLAMDDAGLPLEDRSKRRGVYIGTAIGGVATMIDGCYTLRTQGLGRLSAFTVQMMLPNISVGHVARLIGAQGFNEACHTACAAASNSIGEAFLNIRRGLLDVAVAGGTEASLVTLIVGGLSSMGATSTRNDDPEGASRPFDRQRDGFVPAEGAAILVLEEHDHAVARGAKIYAELRGYGNTNDAYDPYEPLPDGSGAADAIRGALSDGGVSVNDIDYINSHGVGSISGDKSEVAAIKSVFGDRATTIPVSATKSLTGHAIGASGGIDAISTVLSLSTGTLPPSANLDSPDDGFDLNFTPEHSTTALVTNALSNTFAFAGQNVALLFSRYDG